MSATLVGMFDTRDAAETARARLVAAGFTPGPVTGNADGGTSTTSSASAQPADEGFFSNVFHSLFGHDDDEAKAQASTYQEAFRRGAYGLTVDARDDDATDRASDILEDCGAVDVDERSAQWRAEGWTGTAAAGNATAAVGGSAALTQAGSGLAADATKTVKLVEESLAVGKRSVARGGVRVFSRVVEVPVEESIQLREEHADIQRRVVDRPATEADFAAFQEGAIEVRNTAEEAVVSKTARVVGEVEIGTRVTERDEVVRDTVRRTEVDIEQIDGGTTTTGMPAHPVGAGKPAI